MSADSNPPPAPEGPPTPSPTEPPVETLPQKRRYKKPGAPAAPTASEDPDSEIIVLSSMLQNLLARKQVAETGEAEGEVRNKINRFVPRGAPSSASPFAPQISQPPSTEPTPPPARPEANGPEATAAIAFPRFEPRSFQADPDGGWGQRSGSVWGLRGVLYFVFAALVALLAFLAGRGEARRNAAAPKAAPVPAFVAFEPADLEGLDRALAADRAGDLTTAQRLVEELKKSMGANPVLTAYTATLDTRLGHTNDVEAELTRMLGPNTPPEAFAVLSDAQGFNYSRRREFDHAVDHFANVARIQPFNVVNLLHLAESERRAGRLTEAVATFDLAGKRLPVGSPATGDFRNYLLYERRLTLVESGHDADLKGELDQNLAAPAPAPYWWLTAAAVALQKNDLPTATSALQKAQAALPAERFAMLMDDYFFRSFVHLPEMAPFLSAATPERLEARRAGMEYFIDP